MAQFVGAHRLYNRHIGSLEHRLLYVLTNARSAGLLYGQLNYFVRSGFRVALATSPGPQLEVVAREEGVETFQVPMEREIRFLSDFRALVALIRLMRSWQPDIVNAGTPKAGLLGMLAAFIAGVPVRIYVARGLRLETTVGFKRLVLFGSERLASACAHRIIAVSKSLAERYISLRLAKSSKVIVLRSGSSNGVRANHFASPDARVVTRIRTQHALPHGTPVIGYVGRFTRDKGILELVKAFETVQITVHNARLILVGEFEVGDPVSPEIVDRIREHPGIILAGRVQDTAPYFGIMDVLAFPSHREGFPNVPLEAAAAGRPVVGFRSTGTMDAVIHGRTGSLVDVGDVKGLAEALVRYLTDERLREEHGSAGQQRAFEEFAPEQIWEELRTEYEEQLNQFSRIRSLRDQVECDPLTAPESDHVSLNS